MPNVDLSKSLLGEHYLEILKWPIPTSGSLISDRTNVELQDKGSSAISIIGYSTRDAVTGDTVFYNKVTFVMRGAGGFGGSKGKQKTEPNTAPWIPANKESIPDVTMSFKTSEEQAALYRLCGDREAIHIDPEVSRVGGHQAPILHGHCTMGIAATHVYRTYGPLRSINTRFLGVVIPGQTLRTDMWRDGQVSDGISFRVKVVETGNAVAIGRVSLLDTKGGSTKL